MSKTQGADCATVAAAIARYAERPDRVERFVEDALSGVVEGDGRDGLVRLDEVLRMIL